MQATENSIIIFLLSTTAIILLLVSFLLTLLNSFHKRQLAYQNKLKILQLDFEKNLIEVRLEVQEHTMLNVSREIHDSITLSLTLAKLHLNTLNWSDTTKSSQQVNLSVDLLTDTIVQLSNISKSLNSDLIANDGLIKAIENEVKRISCANMFSINLEVDQEIPYLSNQKELIVFRIIQEAFNNIIKHSKAKRVILSMNFSMNNLFILIKDDGIGFFNDDKINLIGKSGLNNMHSRTKMLQGEMEISSSPGEGTILNFKIPI